MLNGVIALIFKYTIKLSRFYEVANYKLLSFVSLS